MKTAKSTIDIIFKDNACGGDLLVANELNAVVEIIDADILENNTEMLSEVNSKNIEKLASGKKYGQHHCHICFKIYLSGSGL